MRLRSILILILVCIALAVSAQDKSRRGGGFNMEVIKKEKAEFLTKEMQLTEAEAKAFLPLEAEYMVKKFEVNRATRHETRLLKQKKEKTEDDYKKITELNLEANKKESEIQIEYFKKFSEVLSAEKVEKYRSADFKFKEEMLKKHRNKRNEKAPHKQE